MTAKDCVKKEDDTETVTVVGDTDNEHYPYTDPNTTGQGCGIGLLKQLLFD